MTSKDVQFSLEHFRRPRSSSSAVALLRKVIDRVETPERYKVVVHTTHPYGLLLRDLSRAEQSEGIVLPKRYILEKGEDHFARNPVGTGPYRLAKHAVGASMRFEAWDHYWRGSPRYKTVTLSISPEESTRVAMLKRGEADIVNITAKRAKEVTDAGFAIFSKSGIIAIDMHLYQNWEPGSYLADPRVREALNLAIDRESILKALFEGRGQVALSGHYGTWTLGHKPVPAYRHDPGRAKTLLAEAFPSGVSLTVNSYATPAVPDLPKVNEAVAAMWAAVGVTTKIVPMDFGAHIDMWRKGRLKNTVAAHNHDNRALLQSVFRVVHHSGSNLTLTKSTELDALIEAVEKQLDLTKMGDLQFQVAKYLRDHHYEVPIVETSALFAANSQKVPKWDLSHLHATYNFAGLVQR